MIAIGAAGLFSAWAAWGGGGCPSCGAAAGMFPGRSLGGAGVVFYALLLAAALGEGPSPLVTSGVLLAAGVHGGLLAVLAKERIFCPPCVGAAVSALFALAFALRCDGSIAFRATWVVPGAALLVQGWALFQGALSPAAQARSIAEPEARGDFRSTPVARGDVRMVVYSRPDCGYCIQLDRDVLPGLVREFGSRLRIERRSAEGLPGLPTPTLLLTGAAGRRVFLGLPDAEDLKAALHELMEANDGRETVLEKSR